MPEVGIFTERTDMLVGESLVSSHMGAVRRVTGREGGTCWVSCTPVTLILSGG